MDTAIQTYIETVQVNDIPWHRLTTTYGRATDFPEALDVLWNMESIETVDAAGEALELNIEPINVVACDTIRDDFLASYF